MFWMKMQWHPNADYEHYRLVCDLRNGVEPFVLGVWHEDVCVALLVGRRESVRLSRSIGYVSLPGIRATAITIIYAGLLGALDRGAASAIVAELRSRLKDGSGDILIINLLREDEALWSVLPRRRFLGRQPSYWAIHWELSLRSTPGFLLKEMRSKHRYWLKRKQKDLEAAFPGRVRWLWNVGSDLSELCEKLESVAKQTYQRGLNAGFVDSEETRARFHLIAGRGQFRACLLEIDGVPKAYWVGEVYKGVFHSAATGYTSDVRQFEVGTLLLLRLVDLLVEEGVQRLDFGLGDAQYKERFGNRSWREGTAYICAPTLRGFVLATYIDVCEVLDRLLRRLLTRLGIVNWVKRLWRRQIGSGILEGSASE